MALTAFQRDVLRVLVERRRSAGTGESYVAGAAALNTWLDAQRISKDIDLFHDTAEALRATLSADHERLARDGFRIEVLQRWDHFVQARVSRGGNDVQLDWSRDSAYRFFPLVEHEELGLTLSSFDLATNKVLALVGRVEPRDWVDTITTTERLQPLGYLAWAACGKDPGFSPLMIIERAARIRYNDTELDHLGFVGHRPGAAELSRAWRRQLEQATPLIDALPLPMLGRAVLALGGDPYRGDLAQLERDLAAGQVRFHQGSIGGAFPRIVPDPL